MKQGRIPGHPVSDPNNALDKLVEASLAMVAHLDLEGLLQQLVDTACQSLAAALGGLLLLAEEDALYQFWVSGSCPLRAGSDIAAGLRQQPYLPGTARRQDNAQASPPYPGFPPPGLAIGPFLSVSLPSSARTRGVLFAARAHTAAPFDDKEERVLQAFAAQAAVAIENALLYAQAERQRAQLEALYRADEQMYRSLHLDQILHTLVDVAVTILQADKSSLMLWDPASARLVVRAAHGFRPETMAQMVFAEGEGSAGQVIATGEAVIVEDTHTHTGIARHITRAEGIRAFMHVPIQTSGQIAGVFNVDYTQPRRFGEDDRRLFQALAQRAATAIENARLHSQSEELARLRERQRIAQDLHDTVVQMLFTIGLEADWCLRSSLADQETLNRIHRIQRLASRSNYELRNAIYALRSSYLATSDSLVELLQDQVLSFQDQSGIAATLIVDPQLPSLPPKIAEAVQRIASEGLANVRKHAQASAVVVSLHGSAETSTITIQDNGVGLADPELLQDGEPDLHFGIAAMRRVTEKNGGVFRITNHEDQGVLVQAHFPLTGGSHP